MALRWPSYLLGIGAGVTTGLEQRAERIKEEKATSAEKLLTLAGLAEKGVPVEDLRTLADEWGVTKYYPKSIGIFGGLGEKYKARQMAEFDKEMGEISKKYRPEELELAIQEGTDLGKALGLSEEEARERIKRLHTTERLILPPLSGFKPEIPSKFKVPPTEPLKFTGLPELKTELKTPYYEEEKPTEPSHIEWEKRLRTPVTEFEQQMAAVESSRGRSLTSNEKIKIINKKLGITSDIEDFIDTVSKLSKADKSGRLLRRMMPLLQEQFPDIVLNTNIMDNITSIGDRLVAVPVPGTNSIIANYTDQEGTSHVKVLQSTEASFKEWTAKEAIKQRNRVNILALNDRYITKRKKDDLNKAEILIIKTYKEIIDPINARLKDPILSPEERTKFEKERNFYIQKKVDAINKARAGGRLSYDDLGTDEYKEGAEGISSEDIIREFQNVFK